MGPLLKTLVFLVLVPGTVAVYIPLQWAKPTTAISLALGVPLMLLGALILLPCGWDFAVKGLGTPAPFDPPRKLVTARFYQYCRNPMYVGIVLWLTGGSIAFRSLPILVYAVAAWLCAHLFVVAYEEPALRRKFGPGYDEYRARVPRWIPRLSRRA